jgi:hypothetical protein
MSYENLHLSAVDSCVMFAGLIAYAVLHHRCEREAQLQRYGSINICTRCRALNRSKYDFPHARQGFRLVEEPGKGPAWR